MNIAIVAPSPIPFVIGGAEKLFWGLIHAINNYSPHKAELIKVPCNGTDFWGIIDASIRFTKLDLSHFDLVIATKDPAWCINHHNIYIYMQHKCRGLYDLYKLTNLPYECDFSDNRLKKLERILDRKPSYNLLPILFEELHELKKILNDLPSHLFSFPGPLTRKIIHWIDDACLSLDRINYWASISKNIVNRENYFPRTKDNKLPDIRIIHHPSDLKEFKRGEYKYIFTASRLETLKRIDFLIKAYKLLPKSIKKDILFYISGTGGQEDNLKSLAKDEKNIIFLGYLSDQQLVDYYSNSLFVPFIPYDEDYGLITVEAMKCAKPVITAHDSGGVTELVVHDKNGLIVEPDPKELANAFEYLITNKNLATLFGDNAIKSVEYITWENTVNTLLNDVTPKFKKQYYSTKLKDIKNILILNHFPIYPPITGGQRRIFYIAKELSKKYNVSILCIDYYNETNLDTENVSYNYINKNLTEFKIPRTTNFHNFCIELHKKLNVSSDDLALLLGYKSLNSLINTFNLLNRDADLIILSHTYLYPLIKEYWDRDFIYDAHNVEYEIKKQIITESHEKDYYLNILYDYEKELTSTAINVITCSEEDKLKFIELYSLNQNKFIITPNGVNSEDIPLLSLPEKKQLRSKLGINDTPVAIFTGSLHRPNYESLPYIKQMAEENKDVLFLVIGSVCNHDYAKNNHLNNLLFLGELPEYEKNLLLLSADIGLNPVITGSGTNLKLVEYACAGLLCLTTLFGARGFNDKNLLFIEDINQFPIKIKELKKIAQTNEAYNLGLKIRKFAVSNYDWQIVTQNIFDIFK